MLEDVPQLDYEAGVVFPRLGHHVAEWGSDSWLEYKSGLHQSMGISQCVDSYTGQISARAVVILTQRLLRRIHP